VFTQIEMLEAKGFQRRDRQRCDEGNQKSEREKAGKENSGRFLFAIQSPVLAGCAVFKPRSLRDDPGVQNVIEVFER
jgi:hypothetical protein